MPAHKTSIYNDGYKKVEFCNQCGQEFPFRSIECEGNQEQFYVHVERKIIYQKSDFISGCFRQNS